MVYLSHPLIESGTADDGAPYDEYVIIEDALKAVYYFKLDSVYGYKEIIGKYLLQETIKSLNEKYVKVEGFRWIDKNATMNIVLAIPEQGKEFVVVYTKI